MCSLNLNMRPSYPEELRSSIHVLLAAPQQDGGSQPLSTPSFENVETSHLVSFSCTLASLLQLITLSTCLCRLVVISVVDAPRQAIAWSSANAITKVASSNCPGRSLMKLMKRSGDRTDSYGWPSLKFRLLPRVHLSFTLANRLVSQVCIHSTN